MTLRSSDARALDLILDRAATAQAATGTATLFAGDAGVSSEQIAAAERVLKLLDAMPAAEPSPDLLRRTLDRVAAGHVPPMHRLDRDLLIDANQPMA